MIYLHTAHQTLSLILTTLMQRYKSLKRSVAKPSSGRDKFPVSIAIPQAQEVTINFVAIVKILVWRSDSIGRHLFLNFGSRKISCWFKLRKNQTHFNLKFQFIFQISMCYFSLDTSDFLVYILLYLCNNTSVLWVKSNQAKRKRK